MAVEQDNIEFNKLHKLYELLSTDSHIVNILPSEDWGNGIYSDCLWEAEKRESRAQNVAGLFRFLNFIHVVDNFEDKHYPTPKKSNELIAGNPYKVQHYKGDPNICRQDWRDKLTEDHKGMRLFFESNALEFSHLVSAKMLTEFLLDGYVGTNKEGLTRRIEDINLISFDNTFQYDQLTTEQKIPYVHEMKFRVYGLLSFLCRQKPLAQTESIKSIEDSLRYAPEKPLATLPLYPLNFQPSA